MSDELKKYVENRRDELEVFSFDPDKGWDEIRDRVRVEPPKNRFIRPWMYAAASVLIVVTGLVIGYRFANADSQSEFADTQFYYQDMVDAKLQLVRQRVDDPEILADLEAMDQAFSELKADLRDDVDNEEVVEAMIDNYRLKLQILERILDELEEESDEEHERNL